MPAIIESLSQQVRNAPESGIVDLVNRGRMMEGVLPLWVGEGDLPTPDFIANAATQSLVRGETFYTWQRGIPQLRQSLADYHKRHFNIERSVDNFVVTGSGMQAIQLAIRATMEPDDEALYLTPAWPNFAAAVELNAGKAVPIALARSGSGANAAWSIDFEALTKALTPKTRVIFVNTPANPSGWTADTQTLRDLLSFARQHNLWIIADEIYSHFYYRGAAKGERRAPSFFDVMEDDDKIIFVNSFSKNWAMTGWRVGWVTIHESLSQQFENLVQYSTSGVAQFMQAGCIAALDEGDDFIAMQVTRAQKARDILVNTLEATGRAQIVPTDGAFYLYFAIDGIKDGYGLALDLLEKAKLGLAPGTAFGPGTENFVRLCFNRDLIQIEDAANRLSRYIKAL